MPARRASSPAEIGLPPRSVRIIEARASSASRAPIDAMSTWSSTTRAYRADTSAQAELCLDMRGDRAQVVAERERRVCRAALEVLVETKLFAQRLAAVVDDEHVATLCAAERLEEYINTAAMLDRDRASVHAAN